MAQAEIGQFSLNLSTESNQSPAALIMFVNTAAATRLPPVHKFTALCIDSQRKESVKTTA